MRIVVASSQDGQTVTHEETVFLVPTEWDDYSYRTEFLVSYSPVGGTPSQVGTVKILARTYRTAGTGEKMRTRDELPPEMTALDPDQFCSLGADGWYYENLGKLPDSAGRRVVQALNDVCFSSGADNWWVTVEGFGTSLLRFSSASKARMSAVDLVAGRRFDGDDKHLLRYSRSQGFVIGGPDLFEVQFDGTLPVPGRLNVVVGKNGVGKTTLLAGLANWFGRDIPNDKWNYRPQFSRVLVLTYNPFDESMRGWGESDGNVRYLGRRPPAKALVSLLEEAQKPELVADEWWARLRKEYPTPKDLRDKLGTLSAATLVTASATALMSDETWRGFLREALDDAPLVEELLKNPADAYVLMSAGQRALIGLWAALYGNMSPQSLVLIDEPENFLHPSLISRFARSFNGLLEARKSFAIVATHSPIVTQETPSRFVAILEREGDVTSTRRPDFETFGESTDNLSDRLFESDFRSSHWKKVLSGFAHEGMGPAEASKAVSGLPLPLLAETYLLYGRHGREKP